MEVVILPDSIQIAHAVADAIARLIHSKPTAVIGLATGSSPLATYDELARRCAAKEISFAQAKGFSLDEYAGLDPNHPECYRNVIEREVTSRLDFAPGAVQGPNGAAADLEKACQDYEAAIKAAGGVDFQILGIGTDGHIAFNEPGSSLVSRTRIKTLTQQTIDDNARFFDGDASAIPCHVITAGLGTVMDARHLALIATGAGKAEAVQQMVEGPVSAFCPGSILQFHAQATVYLDDAAAAQLEFADYYRHIQANKTRT
ncbi:MAG: glucosamine-6-phosphate deaminase [Micrococcales bacterium]|nr:glucosamine-6-phosphate deaminase [Micrococcales bacterium]